MSGRSKRIVDNEILEGDYTFPYFKNPKFVGTLVGVFIFTFVINFPLGSIIKDKIKLGLTRIPGCSVGVKDIEFGFFLPKIKLSKISIPGKCVGQKQNLFLDDAVVYLRGPSFSPIGLATKLEVTYANIPLEVYAAVGFTGSQVIKLDNQIIPLKTLSEKIPAVNLKGDISVNALVELNKGNLSKTNALIESTNFSLPTQNIQGFATPPMNIKNLSIKLSQGEGKKVIVDQIVIGDVNSPLRANFKGSIIPNTRNIQFSRMDLSGEFALGQQILSEFSIIQGFLGAFSKRDEFYQVKIGGTIGRPAAAPL